MRRSTRLQVSSDAKLAADLSRGALVPFGVVSLEDADDGVVIQRTCASMAISPPLDPHSAGMEIDLTLAESDAEDSALAPAAGAFEFKRGDIVRCPFGRGTIQAIHERMFDDGEEIVGTVTLARANLAKREQWELARENRLAIRAKQRVVEVQEEDQELLCGIRHDDEIVGLNGRRFENGEDVEWGVQALRNETMYPMDAMVLHGREKRTVKVYEVWLQWTHPGSEALERCEMEEMGTNGAKRKDKARKMENGRVVMREEEKAKRARAFVMANCLSLASRDVVGSVPVKVKFGFYFGQAPEIKLSADDCCMAWPQMYINDIVIDFWISRILPEVPKQLLDRVYIFHSIFYSWFLSCKQKMSPAEAYKRVRSTTKNVDIFSKDILILPVNDGMHWTLAVICNPGKLKNSINFQSQQDEKKQKRKRKRASRSSSRIRKRRTVSQSKDSLTDEEGEVGSKEEERSTIVGQDETVTDPIFDSEECGEERNNYQDVEEMKVSVSEVHTGREKEQELAKERDLTKEQEGEEINISHCDNLALECTEEEKLNHEKETKLMHEKDIGMVVTNDVEGKEEEEPTEIGEEKEESNELANGGNSTDAPTPLSDTPLSDAHVQREITEKMDVERDCPVVLFLDSMKGYRTKSVLSLIREFLALEWNGRKGNLGAKVNAKVIPGISPNVPRQRNSYDCGIFLLEYFERIMKNHLKDLLTLVETWTSDRAFRKKLDSLLGGSNWFSPDTIAAKRYLIWREMRLLETRDSLPH